MKNPGNKQAEKPISLDDFAPYLLNRITNLLNLEMKNELRELNLTVPRWRVLATLIEHDGLSIGEIAVKTVMDHTSTSQVVTQMEKSRLITRNLNQGDSRFTQVFLTAKGRKTFGILSPKAARQQENALGNLI